MRGFKRVLRIVLILVLMTAFVGAGCGPKKVRTKPRKPSVSDRKKAPATQRPYTINGRTYYPIPTSSGYRAKGLASWYGRKFHGRKTASGERYDMYALTAAHKTLPLGTRVEVTNLNNGRKVRLRINDRGPFVRGRIIDLSYKGAQKLGVVGPGTAPVLVQAVGQTVSHERAEPPPAFKMGPFTIQVGAFALRSNAQRLAVRLSGRYAPAKAEVTSFDYGQKTYYRVRIFNLKTERAAAEKQLALARDGFGTGFIVALD